MDLKDINQAETDMQDLTLFAAQALTHKAPVPVNNVKQRVSLLGKKYTILQKPLIWFINSFFGIAEELDSGDLTLREAQAEHLKSAAFFMSQCKRVLETTTKDGPPISYQESDDATTVQLLAKYAKTKSAMQSAINVKGLYFGNVPVLPMAAFDRAKLMKAGIPSASMQGYTVLEGQYVFGISLAYLESKIAAELDGRSSADTMVPDKEERKRVKYLESAQAVDDMAAELLETFMAKHRDLVVVTDSIAWWEAKWFWLARPSTLKAIRETAFGGSFKVNRWGFPFQSNLSSIKKPAS